SSRRFCALVGEPSTWSLADWAGRVDRPANGRLVHVEVAVDAWLVSEGMALRTASPPALPIGMRLAGPRLLAFVGNFVGNCREPCRGAIGRTQTRRAEGPRCYSLG